MKIKDVKQRVAAELEAAGWAMTESAISAVVEFTVKHVGLGIDTNTGEVYDPAPKRPIVQVPLVSERSASKYGGNSLRRRRR